MAYVDSDWIKKQLGKNISLEKSIIDAEKDHRDSVDLPEVRAMYNELIHDDERHLDALQRIAARYGYKEGMMESVGGAMSGMKSMVEKVSTSDPFQVIGDDLTMKATAMHSGQIMTSILSGVGDADSAGILQSATLDDESHQRRMQELVTRIGIREAQGEQLRAA